MFRNTASSLAFWVLICCATKVVQAQGVDYTHTIKPILAANCTSCHSKGKIGPMPLTTYKEAAAYGKMIEVVTRSGRMPPWKAESENVSIKGVHNLTAPELQAIRQWVAGGLKEGTGKTPVKKDIIYQHLDRTDRIFAMQQRFIPVAGHSDYAQVFIIPTNLDSDILIDALEFVPGNSRIVKSCAIAIDTTEQSAEFDQMDLKYGYSNFGAFAFLPSSFMWYHWTPDQQAVHLPKGFIKKIPAGSKLLFSISYMPVFGNSLQSDSSRLHVRIAKPDSSLKIIESKILVDTTAINSPPFYLRTDDRKRYVATIVLDRATRLHSIMPIGQLICKSYEILIVDPVTRARTTLLRIPEWDFTWRRKYEFETPVTLPAGTQIKTTVFYDNSDKNPNLPILPPQPVSYGESKRQEMFMVVFDVSY